MFLTLEGETDLANVILRPRTYERYRASMHRSSLLVVDGALQTESGVQSVLATSVVPRSYPWQRTPTLEERRTL